MLCNISITMMPSNSKYEYLTAALLFSALFMADNSRAAEYEEVCPGSSA